MNIARLISVFTLVFIFATNTIATENTLAKARLTFPSRYAKEPGAAGDRLISTFDRYTAKKNIPWAQYYRDKMQWSDDTLIKKFQFYSIPRLALIGRDGLIAHERVRMGTAKKVRALIAQSHAETQWGQWRGPWATGFAPKGNPPIEWSEKKNICWKVALPGLGHSSPVVWGNLVFVTTAVPQGDKLPVPEQPPGAHNNLDPFHKMQFRVLAYDCATGKLRWNATVRTAQPHQSTHESGTLQAPSPT